MTYIPSGNSSPVQGYSQDKGGAGFGTPAGGGTTSSSGDKIGKGPSGGHTDENKPDWKTLADRANDPTQKMTIEHLQNALKGL